LIFIYLATKFHHLTTPELSKETKKDDEATTLVQSWEYDAMHRYFVVTVYLRSATKAEFTPIKLGPKTALVQTF
jgi:hypothetical protein